MPPISLTPEQRRALFDQINVTPLRPDQPPTQEQIDRFLATAPVGDELALLLQSDRSTGQGIGSITSHTTSPLRTQNNQAIEIKPSGVSGDLIIHERDHVTRCQLVSFSGITFLVTRIPNSAERQAEIRFWPLNHLDNPDEFNRFTDLFPGAGGKKTLGSNSLATFVGLKRTLTGSVKKEDLSTPKQPGYIEMMFSIRGAHFGLKVAIDNPDNMTLALPGGIHAATLLGVTLQKTDNQVNVRGNESPPAAPLLKVMNLIPEGADEEEIKKVTSSPSTVNEYQHPDIAQARLSREDFLELISKPQKFKLIPKGTVDSFNGTISIFQAGPFVAAIPPYSYEKISVFDVYKTQRDADKLIATFSSRYKKLVVLFGNKKSKKFLPINQAATEVRDMATKELKKDFLNSQISLNAEGIAIEKGPNGELVLEFTPSLENLKTFYLIPKDMSDSEVIEALEKAKKTEAPTSPILLGPRQDIARFKISGDSPDTLCLFRYGDAYFYNRIYADGTQSRISPLKKKETEESLSLALQSVEKALGRKATRLNGVLHADITPEQATQIRASLPWALSTAGQNESISDLEARFYASFEIVAQNRNEHLKITNPDLFKEFQILDHIPQPITQTATLTGPIVLGPRQNEYQFKFSKQGAPIPTFYHYGNLWYYNLENVAAKGVPYSPMLLMGDKIQEIRKGLDLLINKYQLKTISDGVFRADRPGLIGEIKELVDRYSYFVNRFDGPALNDLMTGINVVRKDGEEYLEIYKPQALVKIGIPLESLEFSPVVRPVVVPNQVAFSKEWFEKFPKNHPAGFNMMTPAGKLLKAVSFNLTSEEHPLSKLLKDGSERIFGLVYWNDDIGAPFVYIGMEQKETLGLGISEVIQTTLQIDKLIADPSFYTTLTRQPTHIRLDPESLEIDLGTLGPWLAKFSLNSESLTLNLVHYLAGSVPELSDASTKFIHTLGIQRKPPKKATRKSSTLSPEWFQSRSLLDTDMIYLGDTKAQVLRSKNDTFALILRTPTGTFFAQPVSDDQTAQAEASQVFLNMLDHVALHGRQSLAQTSISEFGSSGTLDLRWLDLESQQPYNLKFVLTPLGPTMHFAVSPLSPDVRIKSWRVAGETIVPTKGDGPQYFLRQIPKQVPLEKAPTIEVAPPPPPPLSQKFQELQEKMTELTRLRRGISHLPLDFANWAIKKFDALVNPFKLGISVQLTKNGVPQTRIGSVRDFKRHSVATDNPRYELTLKWGAQSDGVTYVAQPKDEDFTLMPTTPFDYPDPVGLSFIKKEDGSYQAVLNIDSKSSLYQFLDHSLYGPSLDLSITDEPEQKVTISLKGSNDKSGHFLDDIIESLLPFKIFSRTDAQHNKEGHWTLTFTVGEIDVPRVKNALNKIISLYEETLKQKRELIWKAPITAKEKAPIIEKDPTPQTITEEKVIEFSLTDTVTLKLFFTVASKEGVSEITLDKIHIPALNSYQILIDDSTFKNRIKLDGEKNLKIRGENSGGFYEYDLSIAPVGPSIQVTVINDVVTKKADILKTHDVTSHIKTNNASIIDNLKLDLTSYKNPLTGNLSIQTAVLVLTEDQAHFLGIESPYKIKASKISGDNLQLSFKLGGKLGTITYSLIWNEDGSVNATREMIVYLTEYLPHEDCLQIVTDEGETKLKVEKIDGRLFLKGKNLKAFRTFLDLAGDPMADQEASLVEIIPGQEIRFNPTNSMGSFIPLTEIKLSDPGIVRVRDAIYGPQYQASHGTLPTTGLDQTIIEPLQTEPLSEPINFKPGEALVPTIKTVRMIADAAFNIITPSGRKQGLAFVEETPYEYELLAPESGLVLRVPVLWDPSRPKNPWLLDKSRSVLTYKQGQNASQARALVDPHFVWVDNGGDWQFFFLEAEGEQSKRFQINFTPNEKAPIFIGGAQILTEHRKSPGEFKKTVLSEAQIKRDAVVAHVLSQTETPEEFFRFDKQDIQKGTNNSLTFRFLSTNLAERRWALINGIYWDPANDRVTFDGPITLTIKNHPDDSKVLKELKLVPIKIPDGNNEVVYLTEGQQNGLLKGHVFEWFVNEGLIGLRMMLEHKVNESDFLKLLKDNNIPLLRPGQQYGFKPVSRGYLKDAIHWVDTRIPVLPQNFRGLGYPNPALTTRLNDENEIKALLATVDETYLYPTEETLMTQVLVGQRDNEKMIFYGRDIIVEIPMELSGERYVPNRQTNPHELLKNVRLLIRNPKDKNAWFDLPVFAHPHRSSGTDPVIRLLVGSKQIPFVFVQQFTKKVLGSRAACGLLAFTNNLEPETNTRNRAHLTDYLEFMDMDDEATPIYPENFKLGEPIQLPDGRLLDLSITKKSNLYHLNGIKFVDTPTGEGQASYVSFTSNGKKNPREGSLILYRAAHGSALYYLKDKEDKFWLMAIDDQGKPMFWERKEGIRDFPMADRSSFEMVGLKKQSYESHATSTAIRLFIDNPNQTSGIKNYEIIAPLGRERGSTETSAMFSSTSKAIIKFRVSVDAEGKMTIHPEAKIKKMGRHEVWEDSQIEVFEEMSGVIRIYFKKEREDGYHDYAWIKFNNKADLIGPNFKVDTAHYNRTNWTQENIMPSDSGFMGSLFGAALVYPAYAALANQLMDDEAQILGEQLKASRTGYALVVGLMASMGISQDNPHWNLIFSSLLHKDNPKRQEVTLMHWPESLRQRFLSLSSLLEATPNLSGLLKLATFEAPLARTEIGDFIKILHTYPEKNELLDLVCDEVQLWQEALEDFHAAENFRGRELKDQALARANRAYHILGIIDDEKGQKQIADWISQHNLQLQKSENQPRVLNGHEITLRSSLAPIPDKTPVQAPTATPDLSTETVNFLPGMKNFPKWLRLPVYELLEKTASRKGARTATTSYPNSIWDYSGKLPHLFTLQMGSVFAQKVKGDTPTLVAAITNQDILDFTSHINQYIDQNQAQLLTNSDSKQAFAKDLFDLYKVLGIWLPRVQKFAQDSNPHNHQQVIFGDFSLANTAESLKEAVANHLASLFKLRDAFKASQTPLAVIEQRRAMGQDPLVPVSWRGKKPGPTYEYDSAPTSEVKVDSSSKTVKPDPGDPSNGPKASLELFTNPNTPAVTATEGVINGALTMGNLALKLQEPPPPLKPKLKLVLDKHFNSLDLISDRADNDDSEMPGDEGLPKLGEMPYLPTNVVPLFGAQSMVFKPL